MKSHKSNFKLLAAIAALFFILCNSAAKGQIHTLVNNRACAVVVAVELADNSCTMCIRNATYTIPANSSLGIYPNAPCNGIYLDIIVTLMSIAGQAPVGTTACTCEHVGDPSSNCINSNGANVNGTVAPAGCGTTWSMTWAGSTTFIN